MLKDKLIEILNFFKPISLGEFANSSFLNDKYSLGNNIYVNYDTNPLNTSLKFEVALIFADYHIDNEHGGYAPQLIREQFYRLKKPSSNLRIADLGNLIVGKNIKETNFAVQEVCALLFHLNINVIIIGGTQHLTIGNLQAFKEFESDINLVTIDPNIDIEIEDDESAKFNYLSTLIDQNSTQLYNVTSVGYQSYFVDQKQINKLNELYFEHIRLGRVREKIEELEPVLRDAHLVSFDISSVRLCDAPAQLDGSPNGLYAEEACRIARYAGISDKVQSFGIYEMYPEYEQDHRTAKLIAQVIWYYLEGYVNRKHEFPDISTMNYIKYEVQIDEIDFPIVFYKSILSNRWWIEVRKTNSETNNESVILVSCAESDYLKACENEISDRWWINFKKLS